MTRMQIKIEGLDDLFADIKKLEAVGEDVLIDTLNDVAMDTQQEAVRGIQRGPATGERRTDGSRASAPGEFPMSDTGRLASNVEMRLATSARPEAKVGTDIIYGAYLEFGTSRMAARPWLGRSFRKAAQGVAKELKAKLESRL